MHWRWCTIAGEASKLRPIAKSNNKLLTKKKRKKKKRVGSIYTVIQTQGICKKSNLEKPNAENYETEIAMMDRKSYN